MSEVDALYTWMLAVELLDNLPCSVTASVIDKHYHRVIRNPSLTDEFVE
jgi:hypothetical protein